MFRLFILISLLIVASCGKVNQIAPYDYEEELGASYHNIHKDVRKLDQHVTFNALNRPTQENVEELTEKLTENVTSDEEKARVIHDWLAINIFYDSDRYALPGYIYRPYFYLEVLRSRLTMCGGYTDIFFVMAKMAGLRVASVQGASENRHIWNAIWSNGEWKHIDVTWDAGRYRDGKLEPSFSTNFFLKSSAAISVIDNHLMDGGVFHYREVSSPYSRF